MTPPDKNGAAPTATPPLRTEPTRQQFTTAETGVLPGMPEVSAGTPTQAEIDAAMSALDESKTLISLGSSKHNQIIENIFLTEFYKRVKRGRYKGAIDCIRERYKKVLAETGDSDKDTKAVTQMKAALPAALISGTFKTRRADGLIQHSGRACIDLDKISDRLVEIQASLLTSPYLEAVFLSPTATGLKATFRVPPADKETHKANYTALDAYVRELCGLEKWEVDQKCKDVARLCYVSHDPDLFYNPDAAEFPGATESDAPKSEQGESDPGATPAGDKQKIVAEMFDVIRWLSDKKALVECPGKHRHTNTPGADTDCTVFLDKTANVYCHHNSCANEVEGSTLLLRKRIEGAAVVPDVFSILDLETPTADDPSTLLGDRFLCRGGGMLISGPMHSGKSTLLIQLAMHWAVSRTVLDIKPAAPLKILYIQAENDRGDMAEMRDGTALCLGEITDMERERLRENFIGATIHDSGKRFINACDALLRLHKPDLVLIDPALSYVGGDNKEQTIVGQFLRNNLDSVLHEYRLRRHCCTPSQQTVERKRPQDAGLRARLPCCRVSGVGELAARIAINNCEGQSRPARDNLRKTRTKTELEGRGRRAHSEKACEDG